jgi:hypothetical protein
VGVSSWWWEGIKGVTESEMRNEGMGRADIVAIILASPMASRVARLSQVRTSESIVATEGSVVNTSKVGCVDNQLARTIPLGECGHSCMNMSRS